jgi:hypothetical protein
MKWRDNRLVWGLARALGSATAGPEKAPVPRPPAAGTGQCPARDEADGTGRRRAFEVPVPRRFRRVRPAGPGRLFGGASAHGPMGLLGRPGLHWTRSLRRRTSPLGTSLRARRGAQAPAEPPSSTMRGATSPSSSFRPGGCSGCESKMAQAGTQAAWNSEVAFGKVKSESRVRGRAGALASLSGPLTGPGLLKSDAA